MVVNKPVRVPHEVEVTPKPISDEDFVKSQLSEGDKLGSVMVVGSIINATVTDSNRQSSIRTFTRN